MPLVENVIDFPVFILIHYCMYVINILNEIKQSDISKYKNDVEILCLLIRF